METDVWENTRERLMIHEREGYDINRLMRKNLYRMFVRYGYMQITVETRTELPTCVTNVIREKYPSEVYVGFQAHPNDKEGKSQLAINNDGQIMKNRFWVRVGNKLLLKDGQGNIIIHHPMETV